MALNVLEHYDKVRDGWLLDTNIVSATFGKKPLHDGIAHFFGVIADDRLRLSVITIGEIQKGVDLLPYNLTETGNVVERQANSQKSALKVKLKRLNERFEDRILPVTSTVASQWGTLLAKYQKVGQPLPAVDALIAATAYVHNLVVVSNDAVFSRMEGDVTHYDPYAYAPNVR